MGRERPFTKMFKERGGLGNDSMGGPYVYTLLYARARKKKEPKVNELNGSDAPRQTSVKRDHVALDPY